MGRIGQREGRATQNLSSLTNCIQETEAQLDNLLELATKGMISADFYQQKSEPLKKSLARLQKEQEKTNKDTRSWYEIIETTLLQLSRVTKDFNEGTISDKRRVLSALGSNPILIDKRLVLEEHFWLQPIKKNKLLLTDMLDKVRTAPQQMKNASEEALCQSWLGKIKQALTIYKEDIRNRLEEYNPEK